jgi:Ca-activated chloride channel family protein
MKGAADADTGAFASMEDAWASGTTSTAGTSTGSTSTSGGGTGSYGGSTGTGTTDYAPEDTETETETTDTGSVDCITEEPTALFLSPDDSNSMSSAALAREAVQYTSGNYLPPIRTYEFFNYYDFDYPAAEAGSLAVSLELAQDPSMAYDEYVLQVAVASEARTSETRAPMNLTMVLDTSCSMAGTAMDLTRDVCREVTGQLRDGDVLNMVTWASSQELILEDHSVRGPSDPTILEACDDLTHGGGTDLSAGLETGYALANRHASDDRIDRLLLVSDGGANMGVTDEQVIAENAEDENKGGVYLAGVGVGLPDIYNDKLMDAVTDAGKGASVFAADATEVQRQFGSRFIELFDVAARNVQVELTLPGGFEITRFSAEEIGTSARDVKPQHLAPNDTMVFHQHLWTCAPELVADDTLVTATIRWQDVRTGELRELIQEATFAEMMGGDTTNLRKGGAVFAYAEALKSVQKKGMDESADAISRAFDALDTAERLLPSDPELAEMRSTLLGLN